MRKTLDSPLHGGKAPEWLFARMVKLVQAVVELTLAEYGKEDLLKRLSDPFYFQALGCVSGFDWHSSGLTTTLGAALKIAINNISKEAGLYMAGGKGKRSLATPNEIERISNINSITFAEDMIRISKLTAKVDSSCVQDGYNLYQHWIVFDDRGRWLVIQQGMNESLSMARRYHWYYGDVKSMVVEPHSSIVSEKRGNNVLNLVDKRSISTQATILEIVKSSPDSFIHNLKEVISLPKRHPIIKGDIGVKHIHRAAIKTYENQPKTFEDLLLIRGNGPAYIRALSLVADIVYGNPPSYEDFAVYSFAHGGKDRIPYPINQNVYDNTIETLHKAIKKAKIGEYDRVRALKRLAGIGR